MITVDTFYSSFKDGRLDEKFFKESRYEFLDEIMNDFLELYDCTIETIEKNTTLKEKATYRRKNNQEFKISKWKRVDNEMEFVENITIDEMIFYMNHDNKLQGVDINKDGEDIPPYFHRPINIERISQIEFGELIIEEKDKTIHFKSREVEQTFQYKYIQHMTLEKFDSHMVLNIFIHDNQYSFYQETKDGINELEYTYRNINHHINKRIY